jgi:phycobilisome rod-core linker protein
MEIGQTSQRLRHGDITARDFMPGLLLSRKFREQERIAWSIVIANQGLEGFVDALLTSLEYLEAFGFDTVPYPR